MENKNHKIICTNRQLLELSGVEKVESSNKEQVVCVVLGCPLAICGKNLHVKKLNVDAGEVEIEGEIDGINYQKERKNFFKRIFK